MTAAAPNVSKSSSPGRAAAPSSVLGGARALLFAALVLVLGAVLVLAFGQSPHADPYRAVDTSSISGAWDWFRHPIERNAWQRLPRIGSDLQDVHVHDAKRLWVVGSAGAIFHSRDGGRSWIQQACPLQLAQPEPKPASERSDEQFSKGQESKEQNSSNEPAPAGDESSGLVHPDLMGVHFLDGRTGWCVGTNGTILETKDGGTSWKERTAPTGSDLHDVTFAADGSRGWAVGEEGAIVATSDGGANWETRESGTSNRLYSVAISASGDRGIAVGDSGTVATTRDGGSTWESRAGITEKLVYEYLAGVFVSRDGQRGWAVGALGSILATSDGGATWSEQPSETETSLYGVWFEESGESGFAAGEEGLLFETRDGGATWKPRATPATSFLMRLAFTADDEHGWAVGGDGTVLATDDGGDTWEVRACGKEGDFTAVALSSGGESGFAVGTAGKILVTEDGGATWEPRTSGTQNGLFAVTCSTNGERAWAVGDEGTIVATRDGGSTWLVEQVIDPHRSPDIWLRAVTFAADGERGWVIDIGETGAILATRDGGETWQAHAIDSDVLVFWLSLSSVTFAADGTRGWAVGDNGRIVGTVDGGEAWESFASGTESALDAVTFAADGKRGWTAGSDGTILLTRDGGATWEPSTSATPGAWNSLAFAADGMRGLVVGIRGEILATRDGGVTWEPRASGTSAHLQSVALAADGQRGWTAGTNGTLLGTRDGGATWTAPDYRRYPAPWSWTAASLLALGSVAVVRRKRAPPVVEEASVADLLASDRPLERGDRDVLDFDKLASGVVRFLANEKTEPPLTLAVTGEWGTGKSSLMNLMCARLQDYGFRTIWFNAWHHQTEEHLLGALNQALDREATPRWWTLEGLGYRSRLLFRRGARQWMPVALFLIVLGAVAKYLLSDDAEGFRDAIEGVHRAMRLKPPEDLTQGGTVLALAFALIAPALALVRGLSTFTATSSTLSSLLTGRLRVGSEEGQTGLRQRFAARFRDATEALAPKRIVLFIDDLDRCQPEVVVRVLEMVNFLTSSGKCYVVLGIAPDWVASAVGLGFKDVADEWAAVEGEVGAEERKKSSSEKRREFAFKYLAKLVNIEIPVPEISPDQARALLDDQLDEGKELVDRGRPSTHERLLRALAGFFAPFAPLAFFATLAVLAFVLVPRAIDLLPQPEQRPPVEVVQPSALELPAGEIVDEPTDETEERHEGDAARETEPDARAPFYETGRTHELPRWPAYALLALLVLWGLWELTRGQLPLERDSKDFRDALDLWAPVVYRANPSPRSVKRFLNRVRYMAMCQRPASEVPSRWRWLGGGGSHEADAAASNQGSDAPKAVPEPELVALAALHHTHPDELKDPEPWRDLGRWVAHRGDLFPESFRAKKQELAALRGLERYRELFEALSHGIRIRT